MTKKKKKNWVGRKVDVRLPVKGNSSTHGARPVHQIIAMIRWIRTSRLSIKNSVSLSSSIQRASKRMISVYGVHLVMFDFFVYVLCLVISDAGWMSL